MFNNHDLSRWAFSHIITAEFETSCASQAFITKDDRSANACPSASTEIHLPSFQNHLTESWIFACV
jgi:hypothetical protein